MRYDFFCFSILIKCNTHNENVVNKQNLNVKIIESVWKKYSIALEIQDRVFHEEIESIVYNDLITDIYLTNQGMLKIYKEKSKFFSFPWSIKKIQKCNEKKRNALFINLLDKLMVVYDTYIQQYTLIQGHMYREYYKCCKENDVNGTNYIEQNYPAESVIEPITIYQLSYYIKYFLEKTFTSEWAIIFAERIKLLYENNVFDTENKKIISRILMNGD